MSVREKLGAADLRKVIETFRDALVTHKESINALNVYPVPDGDTGTNMSLTLESVVKGLDDDMDMEGTAGAISHGSLMGARGNSGVILSQIMRGLTDRFSTVTEISATDLAEALSVAAKAAYGAVLKPVEGTILTVVREVAEAAEKVIESGTADLVGLLEQLRDAGYESLERTPTLLPVLADAGVVDAGGRGFLLLIDSLLHVIDGRDMPEPDAIAEPDLWAIADNSRPDDHGGIADLRYEVMFFLDAADDGIDGFRQAWGEIGDSIVVVGGDGIWNCHIHTDHIGEAIEAGIAVGRPHGIRVTDLLEELEHLETLRAEPPTGIIVHSTDPAECAVVAVGAGDGVSRIFQSLGAQVMVLGGQTMNPSTELLLEAVSKVPADQVVLLPNNKNIIAVAEQVNGQTDKEVLVVPTRGIAEGFASLLVYDPGAGAATNAEEMAKAADATVTGEVTRAVRDSDSDVGPISSGDYLGLDQGSIAVIRPSLAEVAIALLDHMIKDDHELITLICGVDATAAVTAEIQEWVAVNRRDAELEVHDGGQPLYPYYIGIE